MNDASRRLALLGGNPAFAEPLHVGRPNIGDRGRLPERFNEMTEMPDEPGTDARRRPASADAPLVSVTMPVYNGAKYLARAIESVLAQSYGDFEFIIADDGSRDDSVEIVRRYDDPRIRLIVFEKNIGAVPALNRALSEARGKYIARNDQDDVSHPTRLAREVAFLEANPDITLVGSWMRCIDDEDRDLPFHGIYPAEHEAIFQHLLLQGCCLGHSSLMYLKAAAVDLGGYNPDPSVRECPDYDLWLRMAERGHRFANIPEFLVDYRIHDSQMSRAKLSCTVDAYRTRVSALHDWGKEALAARGISYPDGFWNELRGGPGSLGNEYSKRSDWHRMIDKMQATHRFAWAALVSSPLSRKARRQAWRAFLERHFTKEQIRGINWYATRLRRLFAGKQPGN